MRTENLRHYQEEAIRRVVPLIGQQERILISMPVGTGRYVTIANILYDYYQNIGDINDCKILCLVDNSVTMHTIKRLLSETFDNVQIASAHIEPNATIVVYNVNSLASQNENITVPPEHFDIITCMDCERLPFQSSALLNFLHYFKTKSIIGITSIVTDNISSYFGDVVYKYSITEAIHDNVLVDYIVTIPEYHIELDEQMELANRQLNILAKSILKLTNNEKTIVFCNNIEIATKISSEIIKVTGKENYSRAVTTRIGQVNTLNAINKFRNDEQLKLLTTVNLLASGRDLPNVKHVVILKNVSSKNIFRNLISGFLRPFPGKTYLNVIDYLGVTKKLIPEVIVQDKAISNTTKTRASIISQARISFRDNSLRGVIGVQDIADELANIIDIMPNESGRMIGIFGEWGRGKTFLMNHTWESLEKTGNFYKVDFHAWKYQETPAIWAYLYEKIATSYHDSTTNIFGKIGRRIKLNFYRLGWYNLVIFLAYFCISLFISFGISLSEKWEMAKMIYASFGIATITSIITLIFRFKNSARELFNQYYKKVSFTHVLGIQAEVQKELKSLIKAWVGSKKDNKKILLFVDDIDRCSEEKIIQLIDSLRIMLDEEDLSRKLIIVTAIDDRILKRAIKLKYIHFTKDGLEQLPLCNLVSEYMDKLFITGIKLGNLTPDEKDEFLLELTKDDRNSFLSTHFDDLFQEAENIEDDDNISSEHEDISHNNEIIDNSPEIKDKDRGTSQNQTDASTERLNEERFTDFKLTRHEINILRKKLQLYKKITPRQIRIFYYRYLIAKNLLIKQYDKIGRDNIWLQSAYAEAFVELLITLTQHDTSQSISELKTNLMDSKKETVNVEGINSKVNVACIDYKILICILDTVIGY